MCALKLTSRDLGPALLVILDLAVLPGQQSLQLLQSAAELRSHRQQRSDQVSAQLGGGEEGEGLDRGEGAQAMQPGACYYVVELPSQ